MSSGDMSNSDNQTLIPERGALQRLRSKNRFAWADKSVCLEYEGEDSSDGESTRKHICRPQGYSKSTVNFESRLNHLKTSRRVKGLTKRYEDMGHSLFGPITLPSKGCKIPKEAVFKEHNITVYQSIEAMNKIAS